LCKHALTASEAKAGAVLLQLLPALVGVGPGLGEERHRNTVALRPPNANLQLHGGDRNDRPAKGSRNSYPIVAGLVPGLAPPNPGHCSFMFEIAGASPAITISAARVLSLLLGQLTGYRIRYFGPAQAAETSGDMISIAVCPSTTCAANCLPCPNQISPSLWLPPPSLTPPWSSPLPQLCGPRSPCCFSPSRASRCRASVAR
jgi:hypothetical protein